MPQNHQNKFHKDTIKKLTLKFASIKDGADFVSDEDKKLWLYFADLYKNSNKGIKGRGLGRKVDVLTLASNMKGVEHASYRRGSGRRTIDNTDLTNSHGLKIEVNYDGFESESGHGLRSNSIARYEDAPSTGFTNGRESFAFGDRRFF